MLFLASRLRLLTVSLFALGLVEAGCASAAKKDKPAPDTGGNSGESGEPETGGTGGSRRDGGGTGGSGGTTSTGGNGGVGGSAGGSAGGGGGADASAQPADVAPADAAPPDANATAPDGPTGDMGGTLATHPWVIPCQADWTRAQCCMHYCSCMMTNCESRLPANCAATCAASGNNWNLKCRVEQCFEALNPKYPADKGSHCGHAVEKPPKCQGIIP